MPTDANFPDAQVRVKTLTSPPSNDILLELYGLFKQASVGDCSGKRPGAFDFKGRAKYDAWAKLKGKPSDDAKEAYVALVDSLLR